MEKRIQMAYEPTGKQQAFHESRAQEVLYGGAAGGGKSRALVMDALMRCLVYPGFQAYLFRKTYPELEETLIPEALEAVPKELGRYIAGSHELRLRTGSVMRFRPCASSQDAMRYAGAEIHGLYIDELTHFAQETYEMLRTRLRARKKLGIVPVVRCASNPGGPGHGWVKGHFVDAGEYGRIHEHIRVSRVTGKEFRHTVQYIPALAMENPHIGEDYLLELEQKPEALRRALLYGDWDAFEGQVFTEFRNEAEHYGDGLGSHVIEPFALPRHWPRFRSFDFGFTRPFSVGWWAIDEAGTAYRYREWYGGTARPNEGQRLPPREIAQGILEREKEEREAEIRVRGVADPSIWDASRGESIAEQMEREGVFFMPGDNSRLAGKMQLHYRLGFGEDGRAGLYVFRHCREWIRTVPSLAYDPARPEDVDTGAEDHAYDETRYFLMERPVAASRGKERRRPSLDPLEMKG